MAISKVSLNRQQLNNDVKAALRAIADGTPFWVDVVVTAALLDGAKTIAVLAPVRKTDQYRIRQIMWQGGGTNFGAGGDRNLSLTDGTTTWTTVPNASIEAIPAAGAAWGVTAVPLTTTGDTKSAAGVTIGFKYSGGTTDHGGVGATKFSVQLEKA